MGAWGRGPFENDEAMDWAWGLDGDDADDVVAEAVRSVAKGRGYLDSSDGTPAVAAATILAAAVDGRRDGLPPEAVAYLERRSAPPDPELRRTAVAALDRVTGEDSEVAELWDDSDDGPEWRESVDAVRRRLAVI